MNRSFNQADVFPIIARLITLEYARRQSFINHRQIAASLLEDPDGITIINRAIPGSSLPDAPHIASNMVAWFSQRITVGSSPWAPFFERKRQGDGWAYRPIIGAHTSIVMEADQSAVEGDPRMFFHLRHERDPVISEKKRQKVLADRGKLVCESCGFWTRNVFPGLQGEVCEIHHRTPLALAMEPVKTTLDDLAVLCPNCHRAIHRTTPLLTVEEFRLRFFT